jgi:soluble lytic murein transglycosylase-like protein
MRIRCGKRVDLKILRFRVRTLAQSLPLGIGLMVVAAICAASSVAAQSAIADGKGGRGGPRGLSPVFTPQVRAWEGHILVWAGEHGLDPNLVATVMQIESCGNPRAVSRSGAQGLFQVMPFHFSTGEDMQDPETNARRGLAYLAESLLQSNGDVRRALAGYNGGHGVIGMDPSQWPSETRRYSYWGEGIFADAVSGRADSARLEEWLAAGGWTLCLRAG